ncbi:MAG: hypothetical protein HFI90_02705 [Clostridia bacterium]|nr:hypothetical protein [Clostridia bacterium]
MKKIALWLCVCLTFISGSAFAMEASIDYDTNLISVNAPAQEQKTALIVVRNKETGAYEYTDLLFAQEEAFSAELKLSDEAAEGEYSVVLVRANETEEELFDFVNVSEGTRSTIVQALSNALSDADTASGEQKLNAFVTQYAWALGIDTAKYGALASKAELIALLQEKPHATFAQIMESFPAALNEAYAASTGEKILEDIKNASTAEITGILKENAEILGITLTEVYDQYQTYVNERLKNTADLSMANVAEKFNAIMAIPYLNAASRSDIDRVIQEQDKYLDIYDTIHKNKEDVVVKILKKLEETEFQERSEILSAIIEVVAEDKANQNKVPSGFGGGGGGGRRPSGADIAISGVPPISPPPGTGSGTTEETGRFNDVSSVPWAAESIEKLADMGIISGKGGKTFAPNDQITRAEVVKILVGAFSLTEESDAAFSDIAADSWYAPYIRKAVAANLTLGDGNGSFRPEDVISRQDIAVMICRFIGGAQTAQLPFGDKDSIAAYAKEAVETLYSMGIISGKDDGNFDPYGNLTRAECAKMVYGIIVQQQNG